MCDAIARDRAPAPRDSPSVLKVQPGQHIPGTGMV
jgi:hypothetical protein